MDYGPPDVELHVPAEQGLGGKSAKALKDVWKDDHSLRFLGGDGLDLAWPEKEKERVRQWCQSYRLADGVLIRSTAEGGDKVVPAPDQRANVVRKVHDFTGHWARSGPCTCSRRRTSGGRVCTMPPRREWRSARSATAPRPTLQSR
jgi:hypothetical protein